MIRYILPVLLLLLGCQKNLFQAAAQPCKTPVAINGQHPMKDSLQWLVNKYVSDGIPGLQVAVRNAQGFYVASGGYANTAQQKAWASCTPSLLFSITKTYTAALIMKYRDKGLINLNKPITTYLDTEVASHVQRAGDITVRMLLNHSAGIVNIIEQPEFLAIQFSDPFHQPSVAQLLQMIQGKPLLFDPGSDFSYSNTNYLLLQLILEKLAGKPYGKILETELLQPLKLQQTWYCLSEKRAQQLGFPDYYFDRQGNGQLENGTRWNLALGEASGGYGGISATPHDVTAFYEALMKGRILSPDALKEMTTWFKGKESAQPDYGLGIEYFQYLPGSTPQMGHEGDGIACTTMILYIPDNQTVLYINCTVGRKLGGPFLSKTIDLKNEISRYAARWR